jgi:hypothetical protein
MKATRTEGGFPCLADCHLAGMGATSEPRGYQMPGTRRYRTAFT